MKSPYLNQRKKEGKNRSKAANSFKHYKQLLTKNITLIHPGVLCKTAM